MAIELIEREVKKAINDYEDGPLRKLLGKSHIHEIRITKWATAQAFIQGTENIMTGLGSSQAYINEINSLYNNETEWSKVIDALFTKFNSMPAVAGVHHELKTIKNLAATTPKGVYMTSDSTSATIKLRLYLDRASQDFVGNTTLDKVLRGLRTAAWREWIKILPKGASGKGGKLVQVKFGGKGATRLAPRPGSKATTGETAKAAFGRGSPFAHDPKSTVGSYGLEDVLDTLGENQSVSEALSYKGMETFSQDLVADVVKNLKLSFSEEDIILPDGNTRVVRIIRGELRKQATELQDWRNIRSQVLKQDGSLEATIQKTVSAMNEDQALASEGSKSAKERMQDRSAKRIMNTLAKAKTAKVIKGTPTKRAKKKIINNIGVAAAGAVIRRKILNRKVKIGGKRLRSLDKKEKGGKSEGSQVSLIKLRSKIQRSLGPQIRRNMGKEGRLHNRTGRFSNSAQLLNLRHTAGGISGEYTYQKFPYQTFEPGFAQGKQRWDPRPLITMSIRELALRHTEEKFTQLRRM